MAEAIDLKPAAGPLLDGPYEILDCLDAAALSSALQRHKPDTVYHLAALLSATAEKNPQRAYSVNMGTLINVLELARAQQFAVFVPSSIGAFGRTVGSSGAPGTAGEDGRSVIFGIGLGGNAGGLGSPARGPLPSADSAAARPPWSLSLRYASRIKMKISAAT